MVGDPVLVVTRTNIVEWTLNIYPYIGRTVVLGITSTLEKAWQLIARDYKLSTFRELPCRFIDTAPWGGVNNMLWIYDSTGKEIIAEYGIDATRVDLFSD